MLFNLMLKPAGARCNLRCTYCYYLGKQRLYGGARDVMSDDLLERLTRDYINSQPTSEVLFTWHGGEPLLRPLSFYRRALAMQQRYADGRRIRNSIQTNGTLLTDDWCRFLRDHDFLVGISIDGPQAEHDAYRTDKNGQPSFDGVMRGIDLLNQYGVRWNGMAAVNRLNARRPLSFYHFFRRLGCRYLQFTPVVERTVRCEGGERLAAVEEDHSVAQLADYSVTPEQWGTFCCTIFDDWVRRDVGHVFIQLFDATLANWVGAPPGVCTLARTCGHTAAVEWNGDLYPCDHFVFPQYHLGNIADQPLQDMMSSGRQQSFSRMKTAALPSQCRHCRYLFACNGECPRNRFCQTEGGEPGLNYLCAGYHRFFAHVAPYMDYMAAELAAHRPPSNIMGALRKGVLSL